MAGPAYFPLLRILRRRGGYVLMISDRSTGKEEELVESTRIARVQDYKKGLEDGMEIALHGLSVNGHRIINPLMRT